MYVCMYVYSICIYIIYISKIKQVKQLLGQPELDRSFDLPNQLWTIPVCKRNDTGQDDLLSESKAPDHANSAMGQLICSSKQRLAFNCEFLLARVPILNQTHMNRECLTGQGGVPASRVDDAGLTPLEL